MDTSPEDRNVKFHVGNLVTTKWIKGHNVRGYGFILSAWDGEAGRGKSLSPEANVNMSFGDDF